ncbi:hypothetical protein ABW19_dt0201094 [Dactylella cylindrospora]|nr:hypothetical protein ABW19_dt0201094 [Dactylella cylindrospora]
MEALSTQLLHRDVSLTIGSAIVALIVCVTVLYHRLVPADDPREPPLIPYRIPWLGSAIPFSRDFDEFSKWIRRTMPPDTPYRLYAGGRTMYFITSPRLYAKIIRISKSMSFDLLELDIFTKIFAMPKEDLEKYSVGMHGMPAPKGMTQEEAREAGMATKFHHQFKENWFNQTEPLHLFSEKFGAEWLGRLDGFIGTAKGVEVEVSLKTLMEKEFLWAATNITFGAHFEELNPDYHKYFWAFEDGFLKLFQETPKWMISGAIKAREAMTVAMEKWLTLARENVPELPEGVWWDEWWGARITWQRDTLTSSKGLSLRARASHTVALHWALTANATPVVHWMLIYILRNPYLIPKLRAELATAITLSPTMQVNWQTLTKLPLFLSIYQETLRLTVTSMTARIVIEDTPIDSYVFKKGRMVLAPSRALHMGPAFESSDHPPTKFWAERFMVDEGERLKLLNSWRPFAGGVTHCPGRYLTATEVSFTIGALLLKYDMELDERHGKVEYMEGRIGTGSIRPDRDAYVKIKIREF